MGLLKKYKAYLSLGLLMVVVIAAGYYYPLRTVNEGGSKMLFGPEPRLFLYTNNSESTGQLNITVPFTEAMEGVYHIDVGVDSNNDGQIADAEWQVKNVPTFLVQNLKNNFWVGDTDKKLKAGDSVLVSMYLKDEQEIIVSTLDTEVTVEAFEIGNLFGFNLEDTHEDMKGGISLWEVPFVSVAYADDKNKEVFRNHNTPDLAQGPMECAAVSAANSIISLAGEHNKLENLPKSTSELIEDLKKDMKHTAKGITLPNMVAGKNAFAASRNLPIATTIKYAPTEADILQALNSGAAVEVSFAFVQSKSGRSNTGHVVTLVGASESELYVHDSGTPEGMDTLRMFGTVKTPKQNFINVPYPLWDGTAYIDAIVIQNWTEAKRAEESYTDVGEEGSEVEMLVIGGKYFPRSLFRVGEHGACQAAHYHSVSADGTVHGFVSKDSTAIVSMTDPLPDSCGFGKVSEVPIEKVTLTFEQSQQLIRYVP